MSWLAFTFLSIISRSIYGLMTKVLSNQLKISAYSQAVVLLGSAGFVSLLLSPLLGGVTSDFSEVSIIAISLVILGQVFGNILYFTAIKDLTGGTAQIAFSSVLIFNALLAVIFLNLHLNLVNVLGIVLLMIAIVSVTSGKIELNKRGVTLMILSALMFSIFQLASAELAGQVSAATYLLLAYFGSAMIIFVIKPRVIYRDIASKKTTRRVAIIGFATAVPSVGNFLFAYYAYRDAPEPAKVAMLLTAQVVLTVILAYFFLKERNHLWRKLLAAVLVLASAFMIKD